jgi:hypothetical protein
VLLLEVKVVSLPYKTKKAPTVTVRALISFILSPAFCVRNLAIEDTNGNQKLRTLKRQSKRLFVFEYKDTA